MSSSCGVLSNWEYKSTTSSGTGVEGVNVPGVGEEACQMSDPTIITATKLAINVIQ